jgi:hypothetical protein
MVEKQDTASLREQIRQGNEIELTFPVINRPIQEMIHSFLTELLGHYGREDLMETLYSILKELIINGVKANMKHHYFPEDEVRRMSEEDHLCMKALLNEQELVRFEEEAQRTGHGIILTTRHSPERLLFLITNTSPITDEEDGRIRQKFQTALAYDSIAEYYLDHADDIEGSGLGITMIVLMLKANNIDPHAFTVNTANRKQTVAKLEFPLQEGYTLERDKDST